MLGLIDPPLLTRFYPPPLFCFAHKSHLMTPVLYNSQLKFSTIGRMRSAHSRTGGIFHTGYSRHTAYSLWFNKVWPYASLNHNEYAVFRAVSRIKMPPVRDYASSLFDLSLNAPRFWQLTTFRQNFIFFFQNYCQKVVQSCILSKFAKTVFFLPFDPPFFIYLFILFYLYI